MKRINLLTSALLAGISCSAIADVKLMMNSDVELLFVDGQKATSQQLEAIEAGQALKLSDGSHQLVFRYSYMFEEDASVETIESEIAIAEFEAHSRQLELILPQYQDATQAELSRNNWNWTLVDNASRKPVKVKKDTLKYNGFQVGRDLEREIKDYNQLSLSASQSNSDKMVGVPVANGTTTAEEMLHFWYQKADKQTKQRFKTFVNKQ